MREGDRAPITIKIFAMLAVTIPLVMLTQSHRQWSEWIVAALAWWVGDDIANGVYRRWKRHNTGSDPFAEASDRNDRSKGMG